MRRTFRVYGDSGKFVEKLKSTTPGLHHRECETVPIAETTDCGMPIADVGLHFSSQWSLVSCQNCIDAAFPFASTVHEAVVMEEPLDSEMPLEIGMTAMCLVSNEYCESLKEIDWQIEGKTTRLIDGIVMSLDSVCPAQHVHAFGRGDKKVGKRLHDARNYLGLSPEKAAELSGVHIEALTHFEKALRAPDDSELQAMAKLYQRSVSYFTEGGNASASVSKFIRENKDLSQNDRKELLKFAEFLDDRKRRLLDTAPLRISLSSHLNVTLK